MKEIAELHALSFDAALLHSPAMPCGAARVHSVFRHVVNLDLGADRLLTLAGRHSDDAPDTLVVDVKDWSDHPLYPGVEVCLQERRIMIGQNLAVSYERARPWHDELPAWPQDASVLHANVRLARRHLELQGKGIGLERSARDASTGLERAMIDRFQRSVQGLCQALAADDEGLANRHIDELVGFGPGLTPAGDDFLLGLVAVLNIPRSPCHQWRRLGAWVLRCAALQTNAISVAALRHAVRGRVRASLIDLCDALLHSGPMAMLLALARVVKMGSSSGSDIALGILSALQFQMSREKLHPLHRRHPLRLA